MCAVTSQKSSASRVKRGFYIVPKPGVEPSEELRQDILAYCSKHIAKYAMPREIEFRKELPKTLVGKVAYRVLEEEANGGVAVPSSEMVQEAPAAEAAEEPTKSEE